MSALKRSASSRATGLIALPSPHNSSVTLFEPELEDRESPPRRSKRVKLLSDADSIVDLEDTIQVTSGVAEEPNPVSSALKLKRKDTSSPRKPKPIPQSLTTPHPAPSRWQETYDTIKEMRSRITAPVDTMGCDQAQHKESDPKVNKDKEAASCCRKLTLHAPIRTGDFRLSCHSCCRLRPKTKSRMRLFPNYEMR
jgi:endonuclease-3